MKRIISILLAILMIATSIPLVALPVFAEEETTYSVGDHIQYGNYPQSKVTDTTTLTKLNKVSKNWISYNYYTGSGSDSDGKMTASDYMKYADIDVDGDGLRDYRAVTFTQYRPYGTGYTSSSTYQYNNGYTPNNVYYFKYEPISWRVLDPSSGLIMCESILDSQTYNDYVLKSGTVPEDGKSAGYGDSSKTYYASDYYNSSIRKWLNEDFYNTAFTLSQKASIRNDVELNNDCYSSSNPQYNSQASYDKIFLLSYDEVKTSAYGFSSVASDLDTARRAQGTDYAKSQGLWVDKSASYYGNSRWWLRSPDFYSDWAIGVHTDGYSIYGRWVIYTSLGVRPACRLIDLKSDVSKSSGKDIGSGLSVKKRVELVSSITALNDNNSITYKDNKYSTDKIEFRANIINRFFSKYATTNNLNKTHEYDKQFDEIVVSIPDTDLLYFKSGILGLGKTTELSYKPNEAITLSIGDSFELTNSEKTSSSSTYHDVLKGLELYVNKSYAWHNDEISKSVDVNISVYYNGEVINSSTETITINNTANENNENVKKEIDKKAKIVADYLKKSTCNLQNSFLEGLFTKEEWKAIQYAFQCKALLSGISKDAYKEMGLSDKIVNKLFKKMGINSYNTVGVYNLNVSLKALANSSQYGELEIEISSVIPYYTYGSSDPFGGISFDFEYEVIGGKGKKKVPKDLLSGDINGVFTFADSSRYLSSLKNLVESELEYAFNLGYGNDFNTVCSYIFGETITDVISKTNYKSYSHIVWESLTAPSKRIEIKCPVDIYVYDEDDNLCATIIDNEIEIDNEDIKIEINGDEKYITVYDGEYRFEYIATATGNMTITIDEFSNMSNKIRTVEFNDIELTTGEIYETTISDLYLNDDYQVVVSDKDVITSDYDSVLVHQPQIVEIVDSDPTCVDEGSKHYECSVCKEVVSSELIPKISHIEEIVPSVDSTCTVSGYTESIRCSSCKTILVEAKVIPATGHTSDNGTITTPATCTKEGVKTYKCTVCSETLKTESIAKTDHKSDSGKVTKSPTCTAEGVKTYSCTVCSTVIKTEKVAMTSHTDSNNDNVCDECGTSLGTEENPSKNCSCNCHKSGFLGFIYKIQRFFWKLFKTHKTCGCGVTHY